MFSNMPEWHPNFLKKRRLRDDGSAFDYYYYYFEDPDKPPLRFDSFQKMNDNDNVKHLALPNSHLLRGSCKLKFAFKLVHTFEIKLFIYSVYIKLVYNVYEIKLFSYSVNIKLIYNIYKLFRWTSIGVLDISKGSPSSGTLFFPNSS